MYTPWSWATKNNVVMSPINALQQRIISHELARFLTTIKLLAPTSHQW
jgi:hypothetical protein